MVLEVYQVTAKFPKSEQYGLVSQMRRAAVSIPANIAEGMGRKGDAELARFMQISLGSASELEYYFILACDLQFISPSEKTLLLSMMDEVQKMLAAFIGRLRPY